MDKLFSAYPSSEVAWSVTTNGSLITSETAARLAQVGAQVVVSIDGLPQVNDAVRHVKAGRGARSAYELALRGLQTLISAGVSTSVSSVISASTEFETMPGLRRSQRESGCREVELTLAMQTDGVRAQARHPDHSSLVDALVGLYDAACRVGLQIHGDWIDPYHAVLANRKFRDDVAVTRPFGMKCQATEHQISGRAQWGTCFLAERCHFTTALWTDGTRYYTATPIARWSCELSSPSPTAKVVCWKATARNLLGVAGESSGDIYNPQVEYCDVYRGITETLLSRYQGMSDSPEPSNKGKY